jgi:hypothetical protein
MIDRSVRAQISSLRRVPVRKPLSATKEAVQCVLVGLIADRRGTVFWSRLPVRRGGMWVDAGN